MQTVSRYLCVLLLLVSFDAVSVTPDKECVVFLHGLMRSPSSMEKVATAFAERGFAIANVGYPSRQHPIEELAPLAVEKGLAQCPTDSMVHFVTHSLGGILVRHYLEVQELPRLGRVVMLAPPNNGSEVVDKLRDVPGFKTLSGPAGFQLGTDQDSVPMKLGPVDYEVGIIAGTETFSPILSLYLPNPDDGRVPVESTKVEGMSDFVILPHAHPFIMRAPGAIAQALAFIQTGKFSHDAL